MMLRSIPEPDEPKAKMMYRNLRNLVERAAVQQAEIDRQLPTEMDSYNPYMASSWSRGRSTPNLRKHASP
jgi:tRNA C32,U32 (ribose-2'-O)-methylase TrmJ